MTEEIIPKSIKTYTLMKNTNNTLEGIEAITFLIRQVALDEAYKESDNVILMSAVTFNLIKEQLQRLKQENDNFETLAKSLYKRIEELEKENEALAFRERLYKADYEASEQENKELKELNKKICEDWEKEIKVYWNALEEIREIVTGNYEVLEPKAKKDIENKINECIGE